MEALLPLWAASEYVETALLAPDSLTLPPAITTTLPALSAENCRADADVFGVAEIDISVLPDPRAFVEASTCKMPEVNVLTLTASA